MKLLIVTQAVDTDDPVLGFFHRWIEEFSKHLEHIEVICLKEGKHHLPTNVRVYSLGKEHGAGTKLGYAVKFLSLAWRLHGDYDAVFVHMNQEYILIAGWLWTLLGKRVYLWRNHYVGSGLTDLAAAFSTNIFYTSAHSYTARYDNALPMPVGVDTERFACDKQLRRTPHSILFLARMAPSKRPEMLIEALAILARGGVHFAASLVGSPLPQDTAYYESLREKVRGLGLADTVSFIPGVPNAQAPELYRTHEIFVNASPSGMLDKTLFEAAASGCRVLAASADFAALAGPESHFTSAPELAKRLAAALRAGTPPAPPDFIHTNDLDALGARLAKVLARRPRPLRSLAWRVLAILAHLAPHQPRMTVLLYHSISDADDFFAVSPPEFNRQMQYLTTQFELVPLARAFRHAAGERVRRDSVAVTFDDGYRDFATTALPILKRHKIPTTVFVLGDSPDRAELGNNHPLLAPADFFALPHPFITVGSHGLTHRKLTKIPLPEARKEMEESRRVVEQRTGASSSYLAYPKGSYSPAVMRAAQEAGYEGAVSVVERGVHESDDRYALPRVQVDSSTTPIEFRAKLSPAADWYYALWKLLH
ncbi:polysaccharide deacetylase family protein [Candidatus Kaiserbacteria bacterium]|nr:polysaccharide deacetylase family protein [Candidatus Kaiserbacteria bacterium]